MITFRSLGRKGNLGNQLFQLASTIGIAKKSGHDFVFPYWEFARFFSFNFPMTQQKSLTHFKQFVEKKYGFHEWLLDEGDYDVNGALQSEKYFDIEFTRKIFAFKPSFVIPLLRKHEYLFEKKPIFISVRRGDFVYHPNYYQLPYKYYFLALTQNFDDWEERNLVFMSDDIDYCKFHFGFLKNAIFIEKLSAIEQLAIGSQGKDLIISNSTFSWWMAWLSEKDESKIVRPIKNFRGEFAIENVDSDFFPSRWRVFDFRNKRIELKYFGLILKGSIYQIFNYFNYLTKKANFLFKKIKLKIVKVFQK